MTVLSRLTRLGLAKETTQGTYVAPSISVPWDTAEYHDVKPPLRDESVRANDSVVQGIVAGPQQADWAITTNQYADLIGHFFVAMGLFDTVSGGAATTLSANASANATTFSVTSASGITTGTVLKIADAAGANTEYVTVGSIASTTVTIGAGGGTGGNSLLYSHTAAGGSVTAQYTHTFKQNRTFSTVWPSYSLTTDDGVDTGASSRGWAGCVASELAVKIDPKALMKFSPKYTGWPSAAQATFSYAASTVQPVQGWTWTVTNGGGSSTRGLTMDITLKRAGEALHASTGAAGPREVFAGALEIDGAYKAIFETLTDMNLFRNYTQTPTVHTLTQPLALGGSVLAITMSQSCYTDAKVVNTGPYLGLDLPVTGIQNATDGGITAVTLQNFVSTAF